MIVSDWERDCWHNPKGFDPKWDRQWKQQDRVFLVIELVSGDQWKPIMFTMIEPRSDRVANTQTKHHCYQVIRTTRVHQSSRSSRMVTVQEKVIRSRLQLGYSTPTNFINRYLSYIFWYRYILVEQFWIFWSEIIGSSNISNWIKIHQSNLEATRRSSTQTY